MTAKVLYFPYIALPNSAWSTRMLLYWDEVGAIVPYGFIKEPERLEPHMRSLVIAGLVQQVIPGMHVYRIPKFRDAFVQYLDDLGSELDRRRKAFARLLRRRASRVHVEKMHDLWKDLEAMRLARAQRRGWFDVEQATAADFMAYLAAVLGRLPELGYAPVTDDPVHLNGFVQASGGGKSPSARLAGLRIHVLDNLLPSPARPLEADDIARFKGRYGQELRSFRRRVEQELVAIADITDAELRQRRLDLFLEDAKEEMQELDSTMKSSGLGEIVFGKLCAIGAAVPGVHWVVGLAAAVYDAFGALPVETQRSPLLYAVHARRELLT